MMRLANCSKKAISYARIWKCPVCDENITLAHVWTKRNHMKIKHPRQIEEQLKKEGLRPGQQISWFRTSGEAPAHTQTSVMEPMKMSIVIMFEFESAEPPLGSPSSSSSSPPSPSPAPPRSSHDVQWPAMASR